MSSDPDTAAVSLEARARAMREHAARLAKLERVVRVVADFRAMDPRRQRAVSPAAFADAIEAALEWEPPRV